MKFVQYLIDGEWFRINNETGEIRTQVKRWVGVKVVEAPVVSDGLERSSLRRRSLW